MTSSDVQSHSQRRTVFAADIGGSFIRMGKSEGYGQMTRVGSAPTPVDDWPAFVDTLAKLLGNAGHLDALAISIAGVVDPASGVAFSANIPCINGRHLADDLASRLGRTVVVANDADCLALAEAVEGSGAGHDVVFCAVLGTGVGGGLIVNGQIVRGCGGIAGEWGHGPIISTEVELEDGSETLHVPRLACGCGQSGCVDTIGGARGIERLHALITCEDKDSYAILGGWEAGERSCRRTVLAYLPLVAGPLAVVVNVTGASIIPVGGGLANVESLIQALDSAVRRRVLRKSSSPIVVPGKCRQDGGMIGAAIFARQAGEKR
jgi:N-acetylglucosamine kinase